VDGLIDNLAPDNILTPYDFGVISPYFFKANFSNSFISSFTLDDLLDPQIASQLIVENPLLSSPGLAFMLHTIGIYGDSASGVDGVVPGSDWISYWQDLSKDAFLSPSWGDAFGTLYSDDSRTMMISYSTSPAYDVCNYDDPSTDIALSTEADKKWGWQQIEGMGVVKGADNTDLAQQFIDWFISETPQENVYLNQWVYPANKNIPMPDCYSSITPLNLIDPINDLIPSNTIATHLNTWLDQWEQAVVLSN
jgi:thiamine transport system substrate-binding protein